MSQQTQKDARSLYHRWRSSSFSEVVAQEHVTRTLRNAVARGRMVHAYLFCGPRGTGKTSTARILAKAVNCLDPQDGEPCNRCASCIAVNQGRAIDLIEIDAASNRGIDDARELRDKIKFSPAESRFKVYIIDEAHMLTSEASNALLKTLEEPPDHAILILATTESHKILPTISSRCQRFDFRRIPLQAIVEQLQMICRHEDLSPGQGVLDRVARMARGSLRDAESLLDQLVAYCGDRIELDAAREVLGLTGEESVPAFADAIAAGDLARGFRLVDDLASAGADLRHFARELVDYLRAMAVAKSGASTSLTQEYRSEEMALLRAAAERWNYQRLLAAIHAFGELDGRMKLESFGQMHLEMAFMETAMPIGEPVLPKAESAHAEPAHVAAAQAPASAPHLAEPRAAQNAQPREAAPASASPIENEAAAERSVSAEPSPVPRDAASTTPQPLSLETVASQWRRIVAEVSSSGAKTIALALEGGHPVKVADDAVVIGVDENRIWRKALESPGATAKVAAAFSSVLGAKVAVRFAYGLKAARKPVPPERDAVVEAAVRELGFTIARVEPAQGSDPGS